MGGQREKSSHGENPERDSVLSLSMLLKKSAPRLLVGYRWSEFTPSDRFKNFRIKNGQD